jgi:hypothetical protein
MSHGPVLFEAATRVIGSASTVLCVALFFTEDVAAQDRQLGNPISVLQHTFTHVAAVRELPNGGLLIVDSHERQVVHVSPDWHTVNILGRSGSGPREYLLPSAILGLHDGRLGIFDAPNRRMLVAETDGSLTDQTVDVLGRPPDRPQPPIPGVQRALASDRRGYFYGIGSRVRDSALIAKWSATSDERHAVAYLPYPPREGRQAQSGGVVVSVPQHPFRAQAVWAVSTDGTVAIVHADPYRVDYVRPDGRRLRGPVNPYERIAVTDAHKEQLRAQREAPRPAAVLARGGTPSYQVTSTPFREPQQWPRYLPPFLVSATVMFAPDGRLWIERTVAAAQPPQFDVLDAGGRLAQRIQLPTRTRLVGFGSGSVYLVRRDDMDLEFLERYSLS